MTNPHRGEYCFRLGSEQVSARPSFEALVEIEQRLGRSIYGIARAAISGDGLKIQEMATIIKAAGEAFERSRGSQTAYNPDRLASLILDEGIAGVVAQVVEFLEGAIVGGSQKKGEDEPPAQQT